jgi:hypothetical protein
MGRLCVETAFRCDRELKVVACSLKTYIRSIS